MMMLKIILENKTRRDRAQQEAGKKLKRVVCCSKLFKYCSIYNFALNLFSYELLIK